MYKQINTQAGNNISDSQPIKTYSKMFQSLEPRFEIDTFILICSTGLAVFMTLFGFIDDIYRNRQV